VNTVPNDATIAAAVRAELPTARAAWLFGSAARGALRADSDLDIAVVVPAALDAWQRYDAAARIAARLGRDVDLLDQRRLSPLMQVQVLATGHALFSDDPAEDLRVHARALRDWQDLRRWRRPMVHALAQRLAAAGEPA
jgi:predicted nucleotidyltransferase